MDIKKLAERWFDEIWNRRNPGVVNELMDPAAVGVSEGGTIRGPEEFRTQIFEPLTAAFPDLRVKIEDVIAEDDRVALRWTVWATHAGTFAQMAPTGRRLQFAGMTWLVFKDGRIVSGSDSYNLHGLLAYLATGTECASVRCA